MPYVLKKERGRCKVEVESEAVYFKIPAEKGQAVGEALKRAIPPSWACVSGSWDMAESGYGLFCQQERGGQEYAAVCSLATVPFEGAFGIEAGPQAPRVKLKGSGRGRQALEALCRSLGLESYHPAHATA